jgi:hypothetical protein
MITITRFEPEVTVLLAVLYDQPKRAQAAIARLTNAELEALAIACQNIDRLCEATYTLRNTEEP